MDLEYSRKELQKYRDANNDLEGKLEQMSDRLGLYIETEAEVKVSMGNCVTIFRSKCNIYYSKFDKGHSMQISITKHSIQL